MKPVPGVEEVQGEGDYRAARRYRKSVHTFVKSGKVAKAARDARPGTSKEADVLRSAELAGESIRKARTRHCSIRHHARKKANERQAHFPAEHVQARRARAGGPARGRARADA